MKNAHGDTVKVLRNGAVVGSEDYDPYGNDTDLGSYSAYKYANYYYDSYSGFYYLRNRFYDSSIGRFISEDPVHDGMNWYAYAGNNPIMFVDPNGFFRIFYDKAYDKYQLGSGGSSDYVSSDIEKMQKRLQQMGYLDESFKSYGYFEEQTLAAVNSFKNANNIQNNTKETEGVVGATTWAYLGLEFDVLEEFGYTLTRVSMSRGALAVDANIVNADLTNLYYVAEALKNTYKIAFGENFNVSTDSVYTELVGHILIDKIARSNRGGILDSFWEWLQIKTTTINIGDDVNGEDDNRWIWDLLSDS